jgi:pyruvate,orthophosphate dikinase
VRFVFPLDFPHQGSADAVRLLVGGKAAGLGIMARDLDLPVPPGFVISTEACRTFLADGWPAGLDDEIRDGMAEIEAAIGRRFGDTADPLLVSVRSGAPVSMPGMMDTLLDLGITDATEAGLGRGSGGQAFARDCRARLRDQFRTLVGVDEPPNDPWAQLRLAIEAVFRSWTSDRARSYREHDGIPEDIGTAVTVQAMVFGNRDERSATGVLFTRNPATGEPHLYGDLLFEAQGEDVVAGTHRTEPIAVLDDRMPEVARELRDEARRLEEHYADLCDIEFTIESGRLWMLQVRVGKRSPQAALRIAVDMAEDPDFPLTRDAAVRRVEPVLARPPVITTDRGPRPQPLTTGLAASPGLATGEIVTSPEAAERAANEGRAVILVRAETSPDDVHGMARAAGILTARGGIASHAAVVARGWGIPAVVGAEAVSVRADGIGVAGTDLPSGEVLTIDGSTGEVFRGTVAAVTEVVPAARILLDWARELGIPVLGEGAAAEASAGEAGSRAVEVAAPKGERGADPASTERPADAEVSSPIAEGSLHVLGVKGFATLDGIAEALGTIPDVADEVLDGLIDQGLVAAPGGMYRLSDAGKKRHAELLDREREAAGSDSAGTLLDGFLVLDKRMKETVTAWQLREAGTGAPPVVNDHSDLEYDRGILDRLAGLATDADAWLGASEAVVPRLAAYRRRLARAARNAAAGDQRYVASPRVDSFHSAWFELHEDLILLAGRTRADEEAAGRA